MEIDCMHQRILSTLCRLCKLEDDMSFQIKKQKHSIVNRRVILDLPTNF